jgi:hypothetical protein
VPERATPYSLGAKEPIGGEVPTAWSICGMCPVEVKVKMGKAREFCGRKQKVHMKYPEKTGETHDRSRIRVVFTN